MNENRTGKQEEVSAAEKRAQQKSRLLNWITFATVFTVAVILALTNPDRESFDAYLQARMEQIDQDEELGFIEKMAGRVLGLQAGFTAEYKSYFFFSTVNAKFGKEEYTYMGVAGKWFILSEPIKD